MSLPSWAQNPSSPTTGELNGHEWVDLGLSVKWATCNVGASTPEEYGNYFAWGETSPKLEYTEENCKTYREEIENIAGNPIYDAARANWGSEWRMPTSEECEELLSECKWKRTKQNDHKGYKITGPNGNSIFLITNELIYKSKHNLIEYECNYWSATSEDLTSYSNRMWVYKRAKIRGITVMRRCVGLCIRAVCD